MCGLSNVNMGVDASLSAQMNSEPGNHEGRKSVNYFDL